MDYLEKLRHMMCDELKKIAEKGEMTPQVLEMVHTLTSTVKNTYRIEMYARYGDDEYDERGFGRDDYPPRGKYHGYYRDRLR